MAGDIINLVQCKLKQEDLTQCLTMLRSFSLWLGKKMKRKNEGEEDCLFFLSLENR